MKKFNAYYYGENNSHCSSCWERDDEELHVLLVPLDLEEMKNTLYEFCNFWVNESFSYNEFLKHVAENAVDLEDNLIYPCIFFEQTGTEYCPDFYTHSNIIEDSYDLEDHLNPTKTVDNWSELTKKWSEEKGRRTKKEKEREEKKREEIMEKQKKEQEQEEFDDFQKMKKKWEGKKRPSKYVPPKKKTPKELAAEAMKNIKATQKLNQVIKDLGLRKTK